VYWKYDEKMLPWRSKQHFWERKIVISIWFFFIFYFFEISIMSILYLIIDIKFFLLICMYPRFALFTAVMMEMCRVGLEIPFNVLFLQKVLFLFKNIEIFEKRGRSQIMYVTQKNDFFDPPSPVSQIFQRKKILYLGCHKFSYAPHPPKAWRNLRTNPNWHFIQKAWILKRKLKLY